MALTTQQQALVNTAKKGGVVTIAQMTAAGLTPTTFNQAVLGTYTGTKTPATPVATTNAAASAPTAPVAAPISPEQSLLNTLKQVQPQLYSQLESAGLLQQAAQQAISSKQDIGVVGKQLATTAQSQQQAAQIAASQKAVADAQARAAAEAAAQQKIQQEQYAAAQARAAADAAAQKAAQQAAQEAQQKLVAQQAADYAAKQAADKAAQDAALAEQQRVAQQQQAAAQAAADAKQAADIKAQQDAQAAAAADFAAKQGAIDAANNARIQAATDKTAMLTIAQNATGIPGGADLLGNYASPQEALTNAQNAYAAAQTAYNNYTGSDVDQRAQLAANLNNAAQLNSFLTRDLATNYAQANQNLPAVNQQYTQAAQTLQQAQNAVSAQQEQASVAKSVADRAAMDKGPLSDVNWGLVAAAALIAVGIYDSELLSLADSGALTEEALASAGVDASATAEAITTGIEGGTIPATAAPEIASTVAEAVAPEALAPEVTSTVAESIAPEALAPETLPAASGPVVPSGQPLVELNAQQTAELMKNIDPNMINSLAPGQAGTAAGTAGAATTGEAAGTSIFSGPSFNPITNALTNAGVTNPILSGALSGAATTGAIDLVTGKPITGEGLLMGALGGGVAGGIGSVLPNPGSSIFDAALNGVATNVGATAVVNLATGQPLTFQNLATSALIGGAIGAGAQLVGASGGTETYRYEDGSSMTVNTSGTPVSVTDNTGIKVPVATVDPTTNQTKPLPPVEEAVAKTPEQIAAGSVAPAQPAPVQTTITTPVAPVGTVDVGNMTQEQLNQVLSQNNPYLETNTGTQVAGPYTPEQEARYTQLVNEGKTPAEATDIVDAGDNTTGFRVDVSGTAGFEGNPTVVTGPLSDGAKLATQAEINSGTATYNPAANAWEVATTPAPIAPYIPVAQTTETTQPVALAAPVETTAAETPIVPVTTAPVETPITETPIVPVTTTAAETPITPVVVPTPVVTTPVTPAEPAPLSPIQTVTPTPTPTIPEVQATTPTETATTTTTTTPTVETPVEPPYTAPAIYVPPVTPPTTPGKRNYGPLPPIQWGSVAQIGQPGLNPGYLMGRTPAEFAGGTPTQATHYWGQHPYVTDLEHITDYNNIPNAQPWGAAYAAGVGPNRLDVNALIRQIMGPQAQAAAVGTAYPGVVSGPIAPTTKG